RADLRDFLVLHQNDLIFCDHARRGINQVPGANGDRLRPRRDGQQQAHREHQFTHSQFLPFLSLRKRRKSNTPAPPGWAIGSAARDYSSTVLPVLWGPEWRNCPKSKLERGEG